MARAHFVNKARKDYPDHGIQKGESYWWWKFRYGGKRYSKTKPRRSQLTQSSFLSELWGLEDEISMAIASEDIADQLDDWKSRIESLRDECQGSFNNIPYQLQDTSDSAMLLQERIDGLDEWLNELENIDTDIDEDNLKEQAGDDSESYEDLKQERLEEILSEIQAIESGL